MGEIDTARLRELQGQLGQVVQQLSITQFFRFSSASGWQPALNAFLCDHEISLCFDLAGVETSTIAVRVESRRVHLSGRRSAPEPCAPSQVPRQVLAMEIDCGPFHRVFDLPADIDPERVTAEQRNGMLWVRLPLRGQC